MTYGIRIKNQNNQIQIDGEYRNLEFTEGGNGISISNNGNWYTNIALTSSPLIPLILYQPATDYFSVIESIEKTGANYKYFDVVTEDKQTTQINWKNYRQSNTPASGYGMRIKDAAGNLIYHSLSSYFKIIQLNTINLAAPSLASKPSTDISHSSIVNPFYILTPTGHYYTDYDESPPGTYNFHRCKIGLKKIDATSVRVGWFNFHTSSIPGVPSGVPEGFNPTCKLIICQIY